MEVIAGIVDVLDGGRCIRRSRLTIVLANWPNFVRNDPYVSNKQKSRSNLYRARKRLRNSLRESGAEKAVPDAWTPPSFGERRTSPDSFHLLAGSRRRADNAISTDWADAPVELILSLLVRPVPSKGAVARYWILAENETSGPWESPVGPDGVAIPHKINELISEVNAIEVTWEFGSSRLLTRWNRPDT